MSRLSLQFKCRRGCINCCDQQGFVYLTEDDLSAAAKFVGISRIQFETQFVYRTRHFLRLRKPRNSQCHFLRDEIGRASCRERV